MSGILERIADAIDRQGEKLDRFLAQFGDHRLGPCGLTPSPTVPIDSNPPPPPPPDPAGPPAGPVSTGAGIDAATFDWQAGTWRRFIAPAAKTIAVPAGFNGLVRLEVSKLAGNAADFVGVTVTEGGQLVKMDPMIGTAGGNLAFQAEGGKTYTVIVEGPGAVVSVNLLIGG